jgi:plastocyanin
MSRSAFSLLSSLLLCSGAIVGGTGVSPVQAQQPAAVAAQQLDPKWLRANGDTKTVTFDLTAGATPLNGALNFNGFRDGEMTLTVPAGWTVVMNFTNHDGMLSHSAEVVWDSMPVPLGAVDPAIPRAYTKDLEQGIPAGGGKDVMRFTATQPGSYLIFCAVPGHGAGGMWIRLKVDASVTAPKMSLTPKPATR